MKIEPSPVVARFLTDGRIKTFPAKQSKRRELLDWVAAELYASGATCEMTESELGLKLAALTDDTPALRRYLVEEGLLARSPGGMSYKVTPADSGTIDSNL